MPESITDRPTRAHEFIFLMTKRESYFYDAEAIKTPVKESLQKSATGRRKPHKRTQQAWEDGSGLKAHGGFDKVYTKANKRDVWDVAVRTFKGAHFATYSPELITPCVLAGTSEKGCCPKCLAPWVRNDELTGWLPACECAEAANPVPCVVLDPFSGSGTTGVVALENGRRYVGVEINEEYKSLSEQRIRKDVSPMIGQLE